jgi:hypothetical protein
MTRSSVPWQVQWKDPTWRSTASSSSSILLEDDDNNNNKTDQDQQKSPQNSSVLGVTSARVLWEELPKPLRDQVQEQVAAQDDEYEQPISGDLEDISLVLTVTLSSSSRESENENSQAKEEGIPIIATFIELELSWLKSNSSSSSFSTLSAHESKSQPKLQSICSRTLRWPGSMLQSPSSSSITKDKKENRQQQAQKIPFWQSWLTLPFLEHLSLGPSDEEKTEGVVTATLCRLPLDASLAMTKENETALQVPMQPEAADALEALDLLSLGLVNTVLPISTISSPPNVNASTSEYTNTNSPPGPSLASQNNSSSSSSPPLTPLQLCCVTASGSVHVYHPWSLLLVMEDTDTTTSKGGVSASSSSMVKEKEEDTTTSDEWSLGMATLLLGQERSLLGTLQHNYPLCRPWQTIKLSVDTKPKKKHNKKQNKNPPSDESSTMSSQPPQGASTTNKTTTNVTSNKQSPSQQQQQQQQQQQRDSSSSTTLEQLLAVWNPLVEPATAHLVTQHNVPTTCCAAGPYLAIAGRGMRSQQPLRRTKTNRQQSRRQRFPTSKRGASTRTSTFNDNHNWWEQEEEEEEETTPTGETITSDDTETPATTTGTNAALSEEQVLTSTPGGFVTFVSLRHYSETRTVYLPLVPTHMSYMMWQKMEFVVILDDEHACKAVAIRIDASSYNDPLAQHIDEKDAVADHSNNNNNNNPIHNQENRYFIRRLQVLPIDIPQGELLSPRLLCGSSPHVSPPALSLAYIDPTSTSVLLVQRTMHRIVPLLADEKSSSSSLGISTQHHPAHVARIEMKLEQQQQQLSQDLWSYLGQVSSVHNILLGI